MSNGGNERAGGAGSGEIIPAAPLTDDLVRAIDELVCYLWDAERDDFAEHPSADHVFLAVAAVHRWLYEHGLTAGQLARGDSW